MKNRKAYIEGLIEVMSTEDARRGIHIDMIADRLCMCGIDGISGLPRDEIRAIANRIILADCRRGGRLFSKVYNPRTGRSVRGYYRLAIINHRNQTIHI